MFKRVNLTLATLVTLFLCSCGGSSPLAPTEAAPTPIPTLVVTPSIVITPSPVVTPTQAALSWEEIIQKLTPSTVMIRSEFPRTPVEDAATGSGTGIVLSEDGYILTNAHVVQGASSWTVSTSGSSTTRPASLVGANACDDLALLKVDDTTDLRPAILGTSADIVVGEEVGAIGYPDSFELGSKLSATRGIVSQTGRQLDNYDSLVQTDAAINHGNSGGPLVNKRGEVIGVNTRGQTDATNINFAISIDKAKTVIDRLKKTPHSQWVGMNLIPNDYKEANDYFGGSGGMIVTGVDSGSPAKEIGVSPADLLTKLEDTQVDSLADVCKILRSHSDGDHLKVRFLRVADSGKSFIEGELAIGDPNANTQPLVVADVVATPTSEAVPNINSTEYDFQSNDGGWDIGENDDTAEAIKDGVYSITLKKPNYLTIWPARNFPDEVDMRVDALLQIRGNARAGVATRYSENGNTRSYYACWIDSGNQYGCVTYVNDHLATLREATQSNVIQSGKPNKVTLISVGDKITLRINDTDVDNFQDSKLAHGQPALYVENFADPAGVDVGHVTVITPK